MDAGKTGMDKMDVGKMSMVKMGMDQMTQGAVLPHNTLCQTVIEEECLLDVADQFARHVLNRFEDTLQVVKLRLR